MQENPPEPHSAPEDLDESNVPTCPKLPIYRASSFIAGGTIVAFHLGHVNRLANNVEGEMRRNLTKNEV
jgi:hypothetical protein